MSPHRKYVRLWSFDYGSAGIYFVTICTNERRLVLGDVRDGLFIPSRLGALVDRWWQRIPTNAAHVSLDAWQVMPNHVHGLLVFGRPAIGAAGRVPAGSPAVVRSFKTAATRRARGVGLLGPDEELWQRGYYEHVVRSEAALARIREYITTNPRRWDEDAENPARTRRGEFGDWLRSQGQLALRA